MTDGKNILFVQNKTHKAGAQAALYSILKNENLLRYNRFLLTTDEGWLTNMCRLHGVECVVRKFPNSRSIPARLFKNDAFAREVKRELLSMKAMPDIVHGNDYLEGLIALKVARVFGAKSAITLRCSRMTRRDFHKYHCDRYDLIMAVGDELYAKARDWAGGKKVVLMNDGLYGSEFSPQKEKRGAFPGRVLVIGNRHPDKGWQDLLCALNMVSLDVDLTHVEFDFTGDTRPFLTKKEKMVAPSRIHLNFIGWAEQFKELAGNYDLAINPSRSESFGRAAMEVLASGVPLISSRTGAVKEVITNDRLLFNPCDPHDMARVLKDVIMNWRELDLNLDECHARIKNKFDIDKLTGLLVREYEALAT